MLCDIVTFWFNRFYKINKYVTSIFIRITGKNIEILDFCCFVVSEC